MTHEELMAGADVLNNYYKLADKDEMYEMSLVTARAISNVVESYEQLLSDYAEMAGCYTEWDERRTSGMRETI